MLTIQTFLASLIVGLVSGFLHVNLPATLAVALFLGGGAVWEQRDLMIQSRDDVIGPTASTAQRTFHWAGTYFACFSMSFTLLALTYAATAALPPI